MRLLRIEDDVHQDLFLLKSIMHDKNISVTIRNLLNQTGKTRTFFDRMRDLGVERQ